MCTAKVVKTVYLRIDPPFLLGSVFRAPAVPKATPTTPANGSRVGEAGRWFDLFVLVLQAHFRKLDCRAETCHIGKTRPIAPVLDDFDMQPHVV